MWINGLILLILMTNDNRPLEIGKNKKVLGKFNDETGGKTMTKFVALTAKTYSFLIDEYTDQYYEKNKIVNKKAKGTTKYVVKREILFNNYLDSLFKNKVLYRSQQRFRSDHDKLHTEEVNKIALSSNDDKTIQTFDRVTTYPYGTNVFKVCENEMLLKKNKVIYDQIKYRLGTDDYLSALMDRSTNLRRNIDTYNEKLKSINCKLSTATHTSNFIEKLKNIFFFSIKMGKTEVENLDLKSKSNIASGIIANAKKGLESFKTEINDFKSYHAMSKKGLNSLNNEFIECLKESVNVTDNLIKIDNDILMAKSEFYINIKNRRYIINNDTLITKANCIKLKSTLRENVKSLKNIKNNLYSVKKDSDIIQIDLKKLKEEFANNINKRAKIRSINTTEIKTNKASSKKSNATCTIKYSDIVDASTSTDDLIAKNYVDASTSTNDLIVKNHVDACSSTDDLIVKNHVDVYTSTDDVCTNENEPCTNENEPCTNDDEYEYEYDDEDEDEDDEDDEDDDDSNDKPGNNDNKPGNNGNKHCNKDNNDNKPGKNDKKDHKQGNKDKDNKPVNNDNKESRQTNFAFSLRKLFLNNITKIIKLIEELNDEIYNDDQWLVFPKLNKINPLVDELIDRVWLMIYNKKREKNEIINISVDKVKDIEGYVKTYNEIVADKLKFVNGISE